MRTKVCFRRSEAHGAPPRVCPDDPTTGDTTKDNRYSSHAPATRHIRYITIINQSCICQSLRYGLPWRLLCGPVAWTANTDQDHFALCKMFCVSFVSK